DVAGADFRHHVGGDDADGGVETLLRRAGAGHDVAQASQQAAGARGRRARLHYTLTLERSSPSGVHASRARSRAASAAVACASNSSRISLVDCSESTMPTLCPAMSEPVSTSPSMTARRKA